MKNNLNVAVCEDDDTQREYICSLVSEWAEDREVSCRTDGYISSEQLIYSFDEGFPYQIYFLDIQMGEINGMELARRIRQQDRFTDQNRYAEIVFLTGLKEYALEGYEVGAFRYLLKPVEKKEFFDLLDRLFEKRNRDERKYFVLQQHGEVIKIPYEEIWYLTSLGHYVEMVYGTREVQRVKWKAGFGKFMREFEENGFVLSYRGVLVNLGRISRVGKTECVLDNGEVLPVSRGQYKELNEAFIRYYQKGEA